jgi:hypothetical protein
MLNGRNIKTKRPSRKLDHLFHGPFQIEKVISPSAVRLTLPSKWRKHPSFQVMEIEPFVAGSRLAPDTSQILREADDIDVTGGGRVLAGQAQVLRGCAGGQACRGTGVRVTGGRVSGRQVCRRACGRVYGWTGVRMDRRAGRRADGRTGRRADGWTGGRVDGEVS